MIAVSILTKPIALSLGALLLSSCLGTNDVVGHYVPMIPEPGVSESLLVASNHRFRYDHQAGPKTFTHAGAWALESTQGHTYLVMRDWQMLRSHCEMKQPSVASFDADGEEIWMIKDLPDCAWRKHPSQE